MVITELPAAPNVTEPEPFAGPDHPMRKVTRGVAFDGKWSAERAGKIAALFDGMAADWSTDHVDEVKAAPVLDALERGGVAGAASWLELGSGTGAGARVLHGRVDQLVCCDLSAEMLANAPSELAPRLRADASRLPFIDDRFDAVLQINMLLFPDELDRVLRPGGKLVWVNTLGDQTPIHLSPADVAEALPGEWRGVTAMAGSGFWTVLERANTA